MMRENVLLYPWPKDLTTQHSGVACLCAAQMG